MDSKDIKILPIAFVITLAESGFALGQDSVTLSVEPSALRALETGMAGGQKLDVDGIVVNCKDQSFTVRDAKGAETVVIVTHKTVIKIEGKGGFDRDKSSSVDELRCGLSLQVRGEYNGDGQLVAKNITIDKSDFKRAETLKSRVHFFKEFPNSTLDQMRMTEAEQNETILWMIRIIDHCKCTSFCGEACAAGGCRDRDGCPGKAHATETKASFCVLCVDGISR